MFRSLLIWTHELPVLLFRLSICSNFRHALGFYHEHQRYDRDTYITVNLTNVRATSQNQFTVNPLTDTNDVGVTYDYQSIMHYGSYAFSSNGERTIIPKQSGVTLIEAYDKTTMSSSDAQVIQKTYAGICNTVATTTTTVRTTTATTARTTTTTRRSGKAEFFRFLGWLMSFFAWSESTVVGRATAEVIHITVKSNYVVLQTWQQNTKTCIHYYGVKQLSLHVVT